MATANETIERLLRHRSVRRFTDEPVGRERLELIIRSAQMASTSSNMQAYSVIAVDDPDKRRQIAEWAGGQRHVEQAPVFLVWCADLYRFGEAVRMHGGSFEPTLEYFIVSTVDAALAAQNAAVAAESLGLGIVYIGGIRNRLSDVAELLQVPPLVYPVFGMCIGVPADDPDIRPRLPLEAVLHREAYDAAGQEAYIRQYDETYRQYAAGRKGGTKQTTWSRDMEARTRYPSRRHGEVLRRQGFRFEE